MRFDLGSRLIVPSSRRRGLWPALLPLALALPQAAHAQLRWSMVSVPGSAATSRPTQTLAAAPTATAIGRGSGDSAMQRPSASFLSQTPAVAPQANSTRSASAGNADQQQLRQQLLLPPLTRRSKPWPSPSLSPGVPSGFIASWGDVYLGASGATAGKLRGGTVDGSWVAGFGVGDQAKLVALEFSGGCGSIKDFCANGSFDAKIGRLLINRPESRLGLAAAWQNFAQWGNEGRQDNTYYAVATYALPLRPGQSFAQTLQFSAGVGNSRYAPYTATDSESKWGGFASIGVELAPFAGLAAGWSGRGANAQLSFTPFRDVPLSLNLLGADLFNQTPAGTVGVLSLSWGTNFRTASFQ